MESVAKEIANAGLSQAEGAKILAATDYGSWWWFIFVFGLLFGLWYGVVAAIDLVNIGKDWAKYRCSPMVIPFAWVFGKNTSENFNYCIQQIFAGQVGGVTGPFAGIMGTIMKSMMTFLNNINSLRVMLATLVGGVVKVIQEFADRFKLVVFQIKRTALKMQLLMRRLFGTFFSVIYMGLSAVTVGLNFSDTFIFRFLDTFCFAPETRIAVKGRGSIPIQNVRLGDVLKDGSRVLSTYKFEATGQPMVLLGDIEVSTNHLVLFNEKWIEAKDHPKAIPIAPWSGGVDRPLICLDTDTHRIPIGSFVFSDWDETSSSDTSTMHLAEKTLNGGLASTKETPWLYQPAVHGSTVIKGPDGFWCKAKDVPLGVTLPTGRVIGRGKRLVQQITRTPDGALVTPSTLVWHKDAWVRAGHLPNAVVDTTPTIVETFILMGTSSLELMSGERVRDMMEVLSPWMEEPTHAALGIA